jgi:hypothetical protein
LAGDIDPIGTRNHPTREQQASVGVDQTVAVQGQCVSCRGDCLPSSYATENETGDSGVDVERNG